jgi:hypothetical protein
MRGKYVGRQGGGGKARYFKKEIKFGKEGNVTNVRNKN